MVITVIFNLSVGKLITKKEEILCRKPSLEEHFIIFNKYNEKDPLPGHHLPV